MRICGQLLVRDKADRTYIIDIAESDCPSTLSKIAGVDFASHHERYTFEIIIVAPCPAPTYPVVLATPQGCKKVRPCAMVDGKPRDLQSFLTERFAYWAGYCDAKAEQADCGCSKAAA